MRKTPVVRWDEYFLLQLQLRHERTLSITSTSLATNWAHRRTMNVSHLKMCSSFVGPRNCARNVESRSNSARLQNLTPNVPPTLSIRQDPGAVYGILRSPATLQLHMTLLQGEHRRGNVIDTKKSTAAHAVAKLSVDTIFFLVSTEYQRWTFGSPSPCLSRRRCSLHCPCAGLPRSPKVSQGPVPPHTGISPPACLQGAPRQGAMLKRCRELDVTMESRSAAQTMSQISRSLAGMTDSIDTGHPSHHPLHLKIPLDRK